MMFLLVVCVMLVAVASVLEYPSLQGTWEVYDGTEMVYQIPEYPKGVLVVAHGCSHSATDWWPKISKCVKCTGLPVEMTLVREGLRRDLIVVAVSSTNRNHKCWTHQDTKLVTKVINHIYERYLRSDYSIPLYLLGASSGGTFVGQFALGNPDLQPKVRAAVVQISAIHKPLQVPVLFNLMEKDVDLITMVGSKKQTQYKGGYKILISPTLSINASYFYDHGAVQSAAVSESVQKALLKGGFLNKNTLHLLEDPRHSPWRNVRSTIVFLIFRKHSLSLSVIQCNVCPSQVIAPLGLEDSLVADASPISEVLNMAWAGHEITDQHLKEVRGCSVAF